MTNQHSNSEPVSSRNRHPTNWGGILFLVTLLIVLVFFWWLLIHSGGVSGHHG